MHQGSKSDLQDTEAARAQRAFPFQEVLRSACSTLSASPLRARGRLSVPWSPVRMERQKALLRAVQDQYDRDIARAVSALRIATVAAAATKLATLKAALEGQET